nr:hypothetical protein [Tanacetum cinerariifolium]
MSKVDDNKFFLGGDMTEKKMSWVRWNQCLARSWRPRVDDNKFFLGGDMTEKKMSWVRWNQCLA